MVLKSIFILEKVTCFDLVIKFNDSGFLKVKIDHLSSPEQVARDLEQLASDIRRNENLK